MKFMSFKSFFKKLFGKEEKTECTCGCSQHAKIEEPKIDSIIEETSECCQDSYNECCTFDECCAPECCCAEDSIKEEPKVETTIEKMAESIKNTQPTFTIRRTTIINTIDVKEDKKVTAKEIKEKVKRKPSIKKETLEDKPKKPTPRKKTNPPKNENPL
jgi:hypothetical protein